MTSPKLTVSQFFVYRRPIAWTLFFTTLAWGVLAYVQMPQRHDPIIPISTAVVLTAYPGAHAETVEQEVTRKIEKKLAESPAVETIESVSRPGLSVVFVELFDTIKDTDQVWQDLRSKLADIRDLPTVANQPLQPLLNSDFGDIVAVMLTISSPPVSDLEIELRAKNIRSALEKARKEAPTPYQTNRISGVLVYPTTLARSVVLRLGQSLLARLTERGLAQDGKIVESAGGGGIDFQLTKPVEELHRELQTWQRETILPGKFHPDVWPGFFIADLSRLESELHRVARDKYTYRELRDFAEQIQDRLKKYPTIGKVELIGDQNELISLFYSAQRFEQFGLHPQAVVDRLRGRNINLPGGRIELPEQNIVLKPSGPFTSEREIGDVVMAVTKSGYPQYLRDLVEIVRSYNDPPKVMNFRTEKPADGAKPPFQATHGSNSEPPLSLAASQPVPDGLQTTRAITLAIQQIKGTQIGQFGRDVNAAIAELTGVLPDDLSIERTSNEPAQVKKKIHDFERNLLEAVIIVVLVALVFMEWRSAILVAVSIPVTVAMTLGLCQLAGVDLQQVSIASLIIALGLLVDDPVVAADAINRELAAGVPRDVAAWLGPQKLARAILYATITNCVAFLPLLIIPGKTGEFIWSLPIVVTASLISSRIVSMTFMPLLGYYVLRGQKAFGLQSEPTAVNLGPETPLPPSGVKKPAQGFAGFYHRLVNLGLAHRWVTLTLMLVLLAGGSWLLSSRLGTAFFPKDLHNVFAVNVYMPEGSPLLQTEAETQKIIRLMDRLEGDKIRSYTTFVGAGGPRFWLSVVPEQQADNYAQVLVHTKDERETARLVERLKRDLPAQVAAARVTVEQLETGPPVGVPVQVRLFGSDAEELRGLAAKVKQELRSIPGTDNIHDDWEPEIFQISLQIDPDRAGITGISNEDVAMLLQTGLSGFTPTQMREKDKLIDVTLRLRSDERGRINDMYNLMAISSLTNVRVPLIQIARFEQEMVAPKIRRRDHQRCLTVKCDAVPGVLPSQIVHQLEKRLAGWDWPAGYRYEFGGEKYEQAKGFASIRVALIISLILIYLALVMQFNSVTVPLVIFSAVPFGIMGGLLGLLGFGAPFGFMAFLGVASLAGVIVSHIIVLFDFIEEAEQRGENLRHAVVEAGLARLRPVLVTVLATVGGLIPLALEGGPLWEPMCYVQIAGLLVAMVVTLLLVPVLYVIFVEDLRLIRWGKTGLSGMEEKVPAQGKPQPISAPMEAS